MSSWEIHQKYGEKMGIRKVVMEKIDKLIDNPQHHDTYDGFIRRIKCKRENADIITYTFYLPMFASFFRENGMTDEEIKYFFLHVFLDLIERRLRRKSNSTIKILNVWIEGDTSVYVTPSLIEIFNRVESFVRENLSEIVKDIEEYRRKKMDNRLKNLLNKFERTFE